MFYRAHARRAATKLGLRGWVRNRDDGTVEAVVEGPAAPVDDFIAWCHRGSPAARVDRLEVSDEGTDAALTGSFDVAT